QRTPGVGARLEIRFAGEPRQLRALGAVEARIVERRLVERRRVGAAAGAPEDAPQRARRLQRRLGGERRGPRRLGARLVADALGQPPELARVDRLPLDRRARNLALEA